MVKTTQNEEDWESSSGDKQHAFLFGRMHFGKEPSFERNLKCDKDVQMAWNIFEFVISNSLVGRTGKDWKCSP